MYISSADMVSGSDQGGCTHELAAELHCSCLALPTTLLLLTTMSDRIVILQIVALRVA